MAMIWSRIALVGALMWGVVLGIDAARGAKVIHALGWYVLHRRRPISTVDYARLRGHGWTDAQILADGLALTGTAPSLVLTAGLIWLLPVTALAGLAVLTDRWMSGRARTG